MKRGDVVLVDFEPAMGGEADKIRPAVVVTNDLANAHGSSVVVVPLTSNIERVYPFQLLLPRQETGLDRDSKAQVELMRSVSRRRLGMRIGFLPPTLITALDQRLRLHLQLS